MRRLVRHRAAQVEHQARALGALHHVHAAQLALADVLAWRGRAQLTVLAKSKAMRAGVATAKLGGDALQRLLRGDAHHDLAALLR